MHFNLRLRSNLQLVLELQQQATSNAQQAQDNKQQAEGNKRQTTKQSATHNKQSTSGGLQVGGYSGGFRGSRSWIWRSTHPALETLYGTLNVNVVQGTKQNKTKQTKQTARQKKRRTARSPAAKKPARKLKVGGSSPCRRERVQSLRRVRIELTTLGL